MSLAIAFSGNSSVDGHVPIDCLVSAAPGRLSIDDLGNGTKLEIAISQDLKPGAKVTACAPLESHELLELDDAPVPGGGALNQSLHFQEQVQRHDGQVEVSFVDTSAPMDLVTDACQSHGIELTSLARHTCPCNLAGSYQHDKFNIRSPLHYDNRPLDQARRRLLAATAATSDIVAVISPKDFDVAAELLNSAKNAVCYLQPTGSLPARQMLELASRVDALACNAQELCDLAEGAGLGSFTIDESSARAAVESAGLLVKLWRSRKLSLRVGAVTLGRRGCVVVDFAGQRGYAVDILPGPGELPTPSGAGDRWHAAWIYYREIAGLSEPDAAEHATRAVAEGIGLPAESLELNTREISLD